MVRVKHRYILVEILTEMYKSKLKLPLKETDIYRSILNGVETLHGDYGLACLLTGFAIKMFNPATRVFVIRMRRGAHEIVATTLPIIKEIGNVRVVMRTLHLSGTIRCALKFLKNYDQHKLTEIVRKLQLTSDSHEMLTSITTTCYEKLEHKNGLKDKEQ